MRRKVVRQSVVQEEFFYKMNIHKSNTVTGTENSFFIKSVFYVLSFFLLTISAQAATFTVTTLADNESDGCSTNQCTLREAVEAANGAAGSDTINFQTDLSGVIVLNGSQILITSNITINGPGARMLSVSGNNLSRVFAVSNPVVGSATANISGLTITGGNALPVLLNGSLIGDGGGILNTNGATLNLTEVNVTGNAATSLGGGVATRALLLDTTNTNITRSTISNNTSVVGGGGVSNVGTQLISSAVTTITNSTISNNNSLAEGGGVSNTLGIMQLTNNTISYNNSTVAGGGIVNVAVTPLGSVSLRNNIIATNTAVLNTNIISSDALGIFNSLGNNLIGNRLNAEASFSASVIVGGNPTPNVNGDIVGSVSTNQIIDPLLGNLQNNGGPTNTRLQMFGSPAINRGNNCVVNSSCPSVNPPSPLTTDQRGAGFPRQVGSAVDIGATEGETTAPATYTVTTLADNETDGCLVNQCTLREAITDANNTPDTNLIVFQNGLTGTIFLTAGQLVPSTNMTIRGPGARAISVSGSNGSRVFMIATPILGGDITVSISGINITGGRAFPVGDLAGDGGGILNGALLGVVSGKSTLNLTEVSITGNEATSLGGGVATRLGAETNITRSLVSANTSNAVPFVPGGDVGGGGISNAVLSTTNISNTTITNNTSLAAAGGILNAAGIVNSTNNTISHNRSVLVGGGVVSLVGVLPPLGTTYLRNTIIARNNSLFTTNIISSDVLGVLGSFQSLGNNLIGNNFSAEVNFAASAFVNATPLPNAQADFVGNVAIANQIIDPLLGELRNNGGQTDSRLPAQTSPVINAGNNCVVTNTCAVNPFGKNPPFALTTDQRGAGYPRLIDTAVEIGAIEVPLAPTSADVTISGQVLANNAKYLSRATVSVLLPNGEVRTTITNGFGYFEFRNLEAGETIVVRVSHKQYAFEPQIITPSDDVLDMVITGFSLTDLKMSDGSSATKDFD